MKKRILAFLLSAALFAAAFMPEASIVALAEGETAGEIADTEEAGGSGEGAEDISVISAPVDNNASPEEPLFEKSGSAKPGEEIGFDIDITYYLYKTYFTVTSDKDAAGTVSLTGEGETEAAYSFDFTTAPAEGAAETDPRECTIRRMPAVKKYTGVLKFKETEENRGQDINYSFKVYAGAAYVDESSFESTEIKGPGEYAIKLTKGYKRSFKIKGAAADQTLSYKSSNKKVATVDKKGRIKGIKKGKAVISVSGTDKRGYAFVFTMTVKVRKNIYTHSGISTKTASKKKPTAEVIKAYFNNGNLLIDLQVYNPLKKRLISMRNVEVKVYDANDKLVGSVKQLYLPTNLGKKKTGIYTLTILKKDLKKKTADIGGGSISMSGFTAGY